MKPKLIVLICVFSLFGYYLRAQPALKGGEISLKRGAVYQYSANVSFITDWPSAVYRPFIHIDWGDGSPLDSLPYNFSNCASDSSVDHIYSGLHTYPAGGNFTVTVKDSFLVPGILNIPNSASQKLVLHQELTTTIYDSPPVPSLLGCVIGGTGCYPIKTYDDDGEQDADGDSLGFALIPHPDFPGYVMPPASIDGVSGLITFSNNVPRGLYNVFVKIQEWRKQLNGSYVVIGTSYEDWIFRVSCSSSVGLKQEEESAGGIKVYPNPANDKIQLEIEKEADVPEVIILNALGQQVYGLLKPISSQEIDISGFPAGIYSLKVRNQPGLRAVKIIKE